MINISEAQKRLSPNSVSLICANKPDKTTNLTTISWWTFLSNNPPTIGFSISKKSYTGELIKANGKAVLCIPGREIADAVFNCGKVSGRDINKAKEFGISLSETEIQYPIQSKLVFKCTLLDLHDVGDHIFYICKIDEILSNIDEEQVYAWGGYSKIGTFDNFFETCSIEQAYKAFTKKIFGMSGNRYVYDIKSQNDLIKGLLLNGQQELKLHFAYLPRVIGLKSLADKKEVKYQRGILTFVMKDGMCHVTSELPVSSQGVPSKYYGFAVITNPYSSGPACTCFLREIDNVFGIFVLFTFRLSSIEEINKRKTRISECMAVRKDDGTSYVYRLLISENFISDEDMRYFEGYLKMGTNENTNTGSELNILIRKDYLKIAEKYFTDPSATFTAREKSLYDDLNEHFANTNKNIFSKLIGEILKNSTVEDLITVNPYNYNFHDRNEILFLGWLRKHGLSARHDKIEKVVDDNVEEIHKTLYPNLHSQEGVSVEESAPLTVECKMKRMIIEFLSNELSSKNVVKYSEKETSVLVNWGQTCKNCCESLAGCKILDYYNSSPEERRKKIL